MLFHPDGRRLAVVSHNIVQLRIDLSLELFPGEVGILLFGSKADQRVAPVFRSFEFNRLVHPDPDLSAPGEFLSFELYVLGRGDLPGQIIVLPRS